MVEPEVELLDDEPEDSFWLLPMLKRQYLDWFILDLRVRATLHATAVARRKLANQVDLNEKVGTGTVELNSRGRNSTMAKQDSSCTVCHVQFRYEDSRSHGKYCSNKCRGVHLRQQSDLLVEAGQGTARLVRNYLLSRSEGCSRCGISDWQGEALTLQMDHIDGNSDNNLLENCRLLCPNCHSQTETFVGRNKKNTRRNNYLSEYKKEKRTGTG